LISVVLWGRFSLSHPYLLIAIIMTLWMGIIGLLDDYLKMQQKKRGERRWSGQQRYRQRDDERLPFERFADNATFGRKDHADRDQK